MNRRIIGKWGVGGGVGGGEYGLIGNDMCLWTNTIDVRLQELKVICCLKTLIQFCSIFELFLRNYLYLELEILRIPRMNEILYIGSKDIVKVNLALVNLFFFFLFYNMALPIPLFDDHQLTKSENSLKLKKNLTCFGFNQTKCWI